MHTSAARVRPHGDRHEGLRCLALNRYRAPRPVDVRSGSSDDAFEAATMIQANALTKRYGAKTAVEDLTFTVRPGIVTGFLGPNGAGKSTTMRMILGLDSPTSGAVTVNGRP